MGWHGMSGGLEAGGRVDLFYRAILLTWFIDLVYWSGLPVYFTDLVYRSILLIWFTGLVISVRICWAVFFDSGIIALNHRAESSR